MVKQKETVSEYSHKVSQFTHGRGAKTSSFSLSLQILFHLKPAEAEISDFDAVVFCHEKIFAFEVAMDDVVGMTIGDAGADVFEELFRLDVLLRAVVLDVAQQISCMHAMGDIDVNDFSCIG